MSLKQRRAQDNRSNNRAQKKNRYNTYDDQGEVTISCGTAIIQKPNENTSFNNESLEKIVENLSSTENSDSGKLRTLDDQDAGDEQSSIGSVYSHQVLQKDNHLYEIIELVDMSEGGEKRCNSRTHILDSEEEGDCGTFDCMGEMMIFVV